MNFVIELERHPEHKHLWEIDHAYYCTEGNFFGNGHGAYQDVLHNGSWNEFLEGWGKSDPDYNLLFRWDWWDAQNPDHEIDQDELHLYFMLQRKGFHISVIVKIEKADEARVTEWLMPRLAHLMSLWEPLTTRNPRS